jgi:hypothetical protein
VKVRVQRMHGVHCLVEKWRLDEVHLEILVYLIGHEVALKSSFFSKNSRWGQTDEVCLHSGGLIVRLDSEQRC